MMTMNVMVTIVTVIGGFVSFSASQCCNNII